MKQTVYWNLELNINPQIKEDLQSLVDEMVKQTEANEPGTLIYEWQIDGDMSECHILERFVDSDALMAHLGNFQAHFAEKFFNILEIKRWQVYGNPSDQVKETLGSMGAQFFSQVGGFSR